ncbi:MATE family efflux transporter [Butyricicoccus pullicaecorum]|nr:MATE family efflux transporter [Butyricicoccus pullicaecorum]
MKQKLELNRGFWINILGVALPIAMQNLITMATSMMDSIMLGRADDTGVLLSAATLANQPFFILSLVTFGLGGAASVLCAQYWGRGELSPVRALFSIILKVAFVVGALFGAAVLLFPTLILSLYTPRAELIEAGASYLRIIGFAYMIFAVSNTAVCTLRGIELVLVSVVSGVASFVTNVFLNWVLIFGHLGAPALGIRGAALATLTARVLEFVIVMTYLFGVDRRLRLRPRDFMRFNRVLAGDLFRTGTLVVLNELCWSVTMSVQAAILGHVTYASGDPVAANSIASILQQLSTTFIFGFAGAAAVLVGKAIGEGDREKAVRRAHTFQLTSFLLGLLACGFILLIREPFIGLYDIPAATRTLARELVSVTAVVTIFVSMATTMIVGILRGAGDVRFCMVIEAGLLWLLATPAAFLAAMVFRWPVPVVLLCMKLDEPTKTLACCLRMRDDRWVTNVTRDGME